MRKRLTQTGKAEGVPRPSRSAEARQSLEARLRKAIDALDAATLHQSRVEEAAVAACRKRRVKPTSPVAKRIARKHGLARAEAEVDRIAARFGRIARTVLRRQAADLSDLVLKSKLFDLVDDRVLLLTLVKDIAVLAGTEPPRPRLKES